MKSISIVNLKGGVGKTVTAVNLAAILATDYEKRVLLVDVDHQGNASRYCGVNTEERDGEEYIRETCPVRVFRTMIRRTDKVDEAVFARKAVAEWSPTSAAARDYRAWVEELMEVLGNG